MKKLLGILVLGLLWCNILYAEIVKSVHGFYFEMPTNYKMVNNVNIQNLLSLEQNKNNKRLFSAFADQMEGLKMDYLFYEDWGGDNISMISKPSNDFIINDSNINIFCDSQLKIYENASKQKLEKYICNLFQYPKEASWAIFTSFKNVFTNTPTHIYTVEFAHVSSPGERFAIGLVCGPKYCDKLTKDFYKVVQSITFNQ